MVIKGQTLSDFFYEWLETQVSAKIKDLEYWEMFFDGSLQISGMSAGIVLVTPKKELFQYVL